MVIHVNYAHMLINKSDKNALYYNTQEKRDTMADTRNDFSKGSVFKNIMSLTVPMTLAQLINVLYSIVDRIYIGRIPDVAIASLTGVGLCLPVVSIVMAFANLFGMGGAPLCSIERGRGDLEEAEYSVKESRGQPKNGALKQAIEK